MNTKITGALYMDSSFYSAGAGVEVLAFEAVPRQQSPLLVGERGCVGGKRQRREVRSLAYAMARRGAIFVGLHPGQ